MDEPKDAQAAKFDKWQRRVLIIATGVFPWWMAFRPEETKLAFSMWGTIMGLDLAVSIVRWWQRRTDPRHAKRPPDEP